MMQVVDNVDGEILLLDAPIGAGETFLISFILAVI